MHIVAKSKHPVPSDSGLSLMPTTAPAGAGARRWQPRRPPHRRRPGTLPHEPATSRAAQVITGQQIKAARELLGWTPYRLAPRAGIGHTLLRQFEASARVPDDASAGRLKAALGEAGVIFTARGVKLTPSPGARAAERREGWVKGYDHRRADHGGAEA